MRLRDVDGIIPLAFACLLLAYVESVSAARTLAQAHGDEIDARQELLGLGAANLGAAFFQAYPVAGGLSQSSVNDRAGARTPLALIFASLTIGLCLMYLTGMLYNLPNVVLAAIVLVAVKGLINIGELRHVWRVSHLEFSVSMVAFAGVLLFGILNGVLVAVLVSMLLVIRRAAYPPAAPAVTPTGSATRTTRPFPVRCCSASRRRCFTSTSNMCVTRSGSKSARPLDP